MKKILKTNLATGLILFLAFPTFAQRYTVGVPVCDTISTVSSYANDGLCLPVDVLTVQLDPRLIPYVSGLKFQFYITAITGNITSNVSSDTVKAGGVFPLPAPVVGGILKFTLPINSSFKFIVRIIGTPLTANESYSCDVGIALTTAVCHNFVGWLISDLKCKVQPSTSVADHKSISQEFDVIQNCPNPFNPKTRIEFHLKQRRVVELVIYNVHGNLIKVLMLESLPAGLHLKEWDGTDSHGRPVASGVYFYRFRTAEFSNVRRMLLLR